MNVPNHEKKAFKDLTPQERSAIVEAWIAGGVEVLGVTEWLPAAYNFIVNDLPYRTRPRQLVIPWEHIKPEYKWAAMDESGYVYFHQDKPEISIEGWDSADYGSATALNINTTGIDWRESLVQRPE